MRETLVAERVILRPLRPADMARRAEWTSDRELARLMGADPTEDPALPAEQEEQRNIDWLHDRQAAGDQLYAIDIAGRYVGDIDVAFIQNECKAELQLCIGDRAARGEGYGTESVRRVLDALRAEPGIDRVEIDVPRDNDRALSFWRKLGFSEFKTEADGTRWLSLPIA